MNIDEIPVVVLGPGSQPTESDGARLSYLDMPRDMATYRRPALVPDGVEQTPGARQVTRWLSAVLEDYRQDRHPRMADLTDLDPESRELINDLLGEGEVSATRRGAVEARSQESILTGVWRTVYLDDQGQVSRDLLEVADVPHLVGRGDKRVGSPSAGLGEIDVPEGVINARSVLVELAAAGDAYRPGDPGHTINLTLLPMSDADLGFLDRALGKGPVEILSRSYGKCLMLATAVENIWWVRYFNSMNTLILNSLEVTEVPQVARAAPEDLEDSRRRLAEILGDGGGNLNDPATMPCDPAAFAPTRGDASTRLECRICWHVYDPEDGDEVEQIPPGTPFSELPDHWRCPQCDAGKEKFLPLDDGG